MNKRTIMPKDDACLNTGKDCLPEDDSYQEGDAFKAIENLVRFLHRHDDIEDIVREMHLRFLSEEALFISSQRIWKSLGLSSINALFMSKLMDIIRYQEFDQYGAHPDMKTLNTAAPFMAACFYGLPVERFYMFCLNHRGRMKQRILLHEGISNAALFAIHKMVKQTLDIMPAAIVLAHNHPGNTLHPSTDDISCTLDAIDALSITNIPVLDHVIIADRQVVSMRLNSFIPEHRWMAQAPKHHLLRHWLSNADPNEPVIDTYKPIVR